MPVNLPCNSIRQIARLCLHAKAFYFSQVFFSSLPLFMLMEMAPSPRPASDKLQTVSRKQSGASYQTAAVDLVPALGGPGADKMGLGPAH